MADAENVSVTDDEFGARDRAPGAAGGIAPQQYYDQLVRAGAAGAVFGDVRRGQGLGAADGARTIMDTDGNVITLDGLREGEDDSLRT